MAARDVAGAVVIGRAGFGAALDGGLAPLKAHLRIEDDAQDGELARLLAVAVAVGEGFTGQALIARAMTEMLPASAEWRRLGLTPVRAIDGVTGVATDGTAVTLAVEDYAIDIDAAGDGHVRTMSAGGVTRVEVSYRAGIAEDWAGLPGPIAQGALRLAAHLYSHRDAAGDAGPPAAVAALWRPWRRMRLR